MYCPYTKIFTGFIIQSFERYTPLCHCSVGEWAKKAHQVKVYSTAQIFWNNFVGWMTRIGFIYNTLLWLIISILHLLCLRLGFTVSKNRKHKKDALMIKELWIEIVFFFRKRISNWICGIFHVERCNCQMLSIQLNKLPLDALCRCFFFLFSSLLSNGEKIVQIWYPNKHFNAFSAFEPNGNCQTYLHSTFFFF